MNSANYDKTSKQKEFFSHYNNSFATSSFWLVNSEIQLGLTKRFLEGYQSNISAQIFDVILKYIYGGIVNLESLAADELELGELANKVENFLIETKA
ncbi:hypothetical protein Glove_117g62 [Diversispora epigaea]|uniref:BTB domain-containing protein n=1 Tax=Diversispora epigaea TaxID=1348612 RepID=A0A397J2L6_9GLOM|nr:hypothetical protein Glove_117g62 [Diversispora epigaea]